MTQDLRKLALALAIFEKKKNTLNMIDNEVRTLLKGIFLDFSQVEWYWCMTYMDWWGGLKSRYEQKLRD